MKIQLLFAWYDLWIGFFLDSKKKWLYFFPIPMFGIILKFKQKELPTCKWCKCEGKTTYLSENDVNGTCFECK